VENEKLNEKGSFTILDFEVEKQFTSSNYLKLQRLADHTGGELFFPEQLDSLVQTLAGDHSYVPTQISKLIVVSLVDFRIILGIIVLALTLEWIIRKFNGLT
ncbi:MAG: VWA domain-containing protein, partial [Arenibacter sp.]|nr:VWA domain-containing protein [Arenibacter sp.]